MRALLLIGAAVAAAEAGAAEPIELLEQMALNVRAVNYRGVFTYQQGQALSSARIVHLVVDGVERERLEQLDGPHREFVRLDHPLSCLHAGNRLLGAGMPVHAEAATELAQRLGGWYAFETEGRERVASRDGQRVRVSPRDPYRYGRMLVLDDASGLPLRSETTDGAGRVLERFQFVDVEIGGVLKPEDVVTREPGSRIVVDHQDEALAPPEPFDWTVGWLPDGFELNTRERRHDTVHERDIETQMYSDGLAAFAVFVEHGAPGVARAGVASQGAMVALVLPRGTGNLVTVVGSIPVEAAELIANSVNFPNAAP